MPQVIVPTRVQQRETIAAATPALRSLSPKVLAAISENIDTNPLSNFCAFPHGTNFAGQDDDEHLVLILRQHPAVFLGQYLMILFLIILAFVLPGIWKTMNLGGVATVTLSTGTFLLTILVAMTFSFDVFIRWYFGVNLVTNKRVVDVDFTNVMSHRFSETRLEHIEDVTHKVVGILGMIFNYGTVYIQTAGSQNEFEFNNVIKPAIVQDTIMDLLELDQDIHGR